MFVVSYRGSPGYLRDFHGRRLVHPHRIWSYRRLCPPYMRLPTSTSVVKTVVSRYRMSNGSVHFFLSAQKTSARGGGIVRAFHKTPPELQTPVKRCGGPRHRVVIPQIWFGNADTARSGSRRSITVQHTRHLEMTTTAQSDPADSRHRYARETRERMNRTMADLRAVQDGDLGNVDRVLEQLRRQEEASRLAGFQGIARLCRDMGNCLADVRNVEPPRLAVVAATLSDVCRTIQLHADNFSKSLPGSSGDDEPRRISVAGAIHSMPPAPMLARVVRQKGGHRG